MSTQIGKVGFHYGTNLPDDCVPKVLNAPTGGDNIFVKLQVKRASGATDRLVHSSSAAGTVSCLVIEINDPGAKLKVYVKIKDPYPGHNVEDLVLGYKIPETNDESHDHYIDTTGEFPGWTLRVKVTRRAAVGDLTPCTEPCVQGP
ncbi:MAG: hypothetical protein ACRBN8_44255 [Nannocystales bacterium]